MINLVKLILKILPWLLVVGLLSWMLIQEKMSFSKERITEIETNTILTKVEQLGKMELVKYNFQEVTEIKKITNSIDFKLFKYKPLPDSKGVLISQGSAAGCIDLTRIKSADIQSEGDTLYISLPKPEICYFKIDLEKSRLYDLQIDYMRDEDRKNFVQELYKVAEEQIQKSALESGILEQTKENAHSVLRPMLESISDKTIILSFELDEPIIIDDN
ncbi:Protein of unknown function [Ekhidna lutea]|uniref:DUF4230 domain-containing protein n=1 Tax=Ekhidna lutea TaxID=447679 RepID=A0A239F8Z2_EKHLU|nr:DUF4230 domain-containing protein [Ekhidna lutea]SNS53267.1 Protein of unknown function [Ekhidna lutea]